MPDQSGRSLSSTEEAAMSGERHAEELQTPLRMQIDAGPDYATDWYFVAECGEDQPCPWSVDLVGPVQMSALAELGPAHAARHAEGRPLTLAEAHGHVGEVCRFGSAPNGSPTSCVVAAGRGMSRPVMTPLDKLEAPVTGDSPPRTGGMLPADEGRVPSPDEAADELCAVLTSMESVGTQHDDAVIVSRSHYERWQRQIGRALLTLDDYSEEPTP